uniref:Stearoyl-CoA desaturase 5 n=1 Tax=Urocitellus parryii TaxID=9999 RepID=A0A8D2IGB5_UROPR
MPGQATDAGKVSFCDAKEEIRAELEGLAYGDRQERPGAREQRLNIVWRNVVLMSLLHLGAMYSLVLIPKAMPLTLLWAYFCFLLTALGVTAGAHRLWSHRSYKAKLPLRIFLAAANSMAFQVGKEGFCPGDPVQKAVWEEERGGLTLSTLVLVSAQAPEHAQSVPIFF